MFTGLVQAIGRVERVEAVPEGVRLVIDPCGWDPGAGRGTRGETGAKVADLEADTPASQEPAGIEDPSGTHRGPIGWSLGTHGPVEIHGDPWAFGDPWTLGAGALVPQHNLL